jgi:hypothetical protein
MKRFIVYGLVDEDENDLPDVVEVEAEDKVEAKRIACERVNAYWTERTEVEEVQPCSS